MSIYIKGMEMPNTCYDCPFQIDECFGSIKCRYAKTWGSYSSRAVDCHLIPVPDHGRLIDADALLAEHYEGDANPGWIKSAAIITPQLVSNLPTIIPADKEAT